MLLTRIRRKRVNRKYSSRRRTFFFHRQVAPAWHAAEGRLCGRRGCQFSTIGTHRKNYTWQPWRRQTLGGWTQHLWDNDENKERGKKNRREKTFQVLVSSSVLLSLLCDVCDGIRLIWLCEGWQARYMCLLYLVWHPKYTPCVRWWFANSISETFILLSMMTSLSNSSAMTLFSANTAADTVFFYSDVVLKLQWGQQNKQVLKIFKTAIK